MMEPLHGYTKQGRPVHGSVLDHLRHEAQHASSSYARLNNRVALWIVSHVGTMTCTWLFLVLALLSLPATLVTAHVVAGALFNWFGMYVASAGLIALVTWTAQSFLQLVLLPAIMVGQNIQNAASDARSAKTFEDTEKIVDLLQLDTEGGLKDLRDELLARIDHLDERL